MDLVLPAQWFDNDFLFVTDAIDSI